MDWRKWLAVVLGAGLTLAGAGCVSKAKATANAKAAFAAGQQAAARSQQLAANSVSVVGPVRFPRVAWTEDLTLARVLVLAEYFGPQDPQVIAVTRNGETATFTAGQLLKGEDIAMEPGDIVEIK